MIYSPIWKDIYYEVNASNLSYYIKVDNEVIFSGKAYRMPNSSTLKININKICQNYLSSDISSAFGASGSLSVLHTDAIRTFTLYDTDDNVLETYRFLYDWSYTNEWIGGIGNSSPLSRPINNKYISGQLNPLTMYTNQDKVRTIFQQRINVTPSVINGPNRVNGFIDTVSEINAVVGGTQICGDYVLYYLNSFGGWDAFAIEGATKKTDNITQYTTDKSFDNTSYDFEANRYISEISTAYVMQTGWLTDEQSTNLAKNLIGSNKVYIHNVTEGWIKPAVITDTKVEYQTYQTNGNKMAQYSINIKESQSKIRR